METIIAVLTGIGLSAACGFRIFVPLLVLNLASLYGYIHLAPGFGWLGGHYATVALVSATVLEISAYYVPWLDNVMDAIASPVSVIAGTIATASIIVDMPPSLRWMISIIAGGGIAGLLQGSTVALRAKSSLFTGGLGNAFIATIELVGSVVTSLLALIIPVLGVIIVIVFISYYLLRSGRLIFKRTKKAGR